MATKKIIAICQSGGDFKLGKDDSLSYDGGEAYAVDLDQHTLLSDFKKELAEIFQYSVDGMVIKYFLPGNRKTLITISRDKDLQRMVNFCEDSDQVEVFIMTEEGAARNVSNMPASRSSRTTASEAMVLPSHMVQADDTIDIEMDAANESTPGGTIRVNNGEKHRTAATQWENTITGMDQRFSSFTEFREALHKYSIAHGFTYKFKKNDSQRVSVICKSEGCPWRIWASKVASTQLIRIKKMNTTHTCEGAALKAEHRAVDRAHQC